jgi:hypothetical protein
MTSKISSSRALSASYSRRSSSSTAVIMYRGSCIRHSEDSGRPRIATLPGVDLDAAAHEYRRALAAVDAAKATAQRRLAVAREQAEAARVTLAEAMVAARNGVRLVEIERATGYTKERVRQILGASGVEPD